MIVYKKDDALEAFDYNQCTLLIHGCNCQKVMGAGIAKQIKQRFPGAYEADKNNKCLPIYKQTFLYSKNAPSLKLGYYTVYPILYDQKYKFICNLYTQEYPERQTDLPLLYRNIKKGLLRIKRDFSEYPNLVIGMPKIGAGLAGGNWLAIEHIINTVFEEKEVYVYQI